MHWTVWQEDKPFVPNLDKFGFVYIITNTKTGKAYGKAYVGCKQYFIGKSKKKTLSRWETYTGSSKYLNEDIKKDGKEKFKFEAIAEYKNKRSLRYYEAYYQMKWDVLTATMKDSDDPAFYNSYVGGKFYRPIESYTPHTEEVKKKISEANSGEKHGLYKGKVEFYLDGKRMVVDCLSVWAKENGYRAGNLYKIAQTNKDGFVINKRINKNTKTLQSPFLISGRYLCMERVLSHKGPLGTITKVRWLRDGES